MTEPLISVIVPIYKVELYLDQCVSSIVNQTYQNLEIILVDDGSPDNCSKMCDEWATKDSRIKVIHKSNGGLSDARNAGLEITNGDYTAFVDSDDYIASSMIDSLLTIAIKEHAEIVECNYLLFYDNEKKQEILDKNESYTIFNKEEALKELITENKFKHVVWNKLYKKSILKGLRFEIGKLHEDTFFTYQAFNNCSNIVKIEDSLYFYRQRSDSIMGTKFSIRNLDSLEARQNIYRFARDNYPNLSTIAQEKLLLNCIYLGQKALQTKDKKLIKQAFEKIKKTYITAYQCQRPECSFSYQIWYIVGFVDLKGCCAIRNLLKIGL